MSLTDYARQLRKWTKEEEDSVYQLRDVNGWGPKRISKELNIPVDQVRFWLYRKGKPGKKKKPYKNTPERLKANESKRYYRTKFTDWFHWKANTLRSSLSKRHRDNPDIHSLTPTGKQIKEWIIETDKACHYCKIILDNKNLSVDHAVPVSRGGTSELSNLRLVCKHCNLSKGSLSEGEYLSLLDLVSLWEDGGKSLCARLKRGFIPR